MLVSDFNYDLPDSAIAKYPPKTRGTTRLLVLNRRDGSIIDSKYADLANWLAPGDLVILNDTKVMRARLFTQLPDGRKRELVVLEAHAMHPSVKLPNISSPNGRAVMYRGKLHAGDILTIINARTKEPTPYQVQVMAILGNGLAKIDLKPGQPKSNLDEMIEQYGTVPLPPYLKREAEPADIERYQTVWAEHLGSAAAPTASLNMTTEILASLRANDVQVQHLTLHVGLGTFLPIRTDQVEAHQMHAEFFHIPAETIQAVQATKARGGRVVAVGTTVARTLEYWAKTGQTTGEDDIFIYPGFKFKLIDALLTNFHAPKSTVLMLAAAFAGWENLRPAYYHAIENGYKLLSYGDSMLIC